MEADESLEEEDDEEEEEEEDIKTSKKRPAPSLTPKSQVCFAFFKFYRWMQLLYYSTLVFVSQKKMKVDPKEDDDDDDEWVLFHRLLYLRFTF